MNLKPMGFIGIAKSEKDWLRGTLVQVLEVDSSCTWCPYKVVIIDKSHRHYGMITWAIDVKETKERISQ